MGAGAVEAYQPQPNSEYLVNGARETVAER